MRTILHILNGTERGGCEVNALNLVRATPGLGHRLLVLGGEGPLSAAFAAEGAEVRHAPGAARGTRAVIGAVAESVRDPSPEGVIVWHGMVSLPGILHALRDFRGKVLVHGGNPAGSLSPVVDWRYWLREKRLGARAAATYVCCSRHVADSFAGSRYLRRFPRVVVPNGVKAPGPAAPAPRELEPEGPAVIGMVARLDGIKDHPTLLRAFARLVRSRPGTRLELVGDGARRAALEALAAELGIGDRVVFHGMVDDVGEVMRPWDLFAYATTEAEGLGNALAEAMMLGLPCVVTDAGPMREVAGDPPATRLVPPGDPAALAGAMEALLASRPERTALAEAGRARATASFSLERFAAGYTGLLGVDGGEAG